MIYYIKNHLLEEGILEHVKNNVGKYALAGATTAAAAAGELGDTAQSVAHSGGDIIKASANKLTDVVNGTKDYITKESSPSASTSSTETSITPATKTPIENLNPTEALARHNSIKIPDSMNHRDYAAHVDKGKALYNTNNNYLINQEANAELVKYHATPEGRLEKFKDTVPGDQGKLVDSGFFNKYYKDYKADIDNNSNLYWKDGERSEGTQAGNITKAGFGLAGVGALGIGALRRANKNLHK